MSEWQKAKCPKCGNVYDQWACAVIDGDGSITFSNDEADISDVIVTYVYMACPNPHCNFFLNDVSVSELTDWFLKNKVED